MRKGILTTAFIILILIIQNNTIMAFELFKLPYATDALEPVISKRTVELHWGKHVQTYVNNLNNLIKGTEFENATLEEIIKKSDGGIFNNGAQVWNHEFYFNTFSKNGGGSPTGPLAEAINKTYGGFEEFKKEFTTASTSLFGSGWVWLSKDKEGKLSIQKESNAGNPIRVGLIPLLGFDVWEHSYYLDYENRRVEHIENLWKIIDWRIVEDRYIK